MIHLDLAHWVHVIGYIGILIIIFAQTGLLLGFFFPGDSLLFTAGFLASQGYLHIGLLTVSVTITAILGYAVAYWLGKKIGHWLLRRPDKWYFKKRYLEQARTFYDKHGGKALILGRLVPVIRTFVPVVAGMTDMNVWRYNFYNIIGGVIWAAGVTLLGYYLGEKIPGVQHYILPAVLVIIFLSVLPGVWHLWQAKKSDNTQ